MEPVRPLEGVPLAPLSTLHVGGAARYYLAAASAEDVWRGARWARERGLPLLLLGGGSNLLVADEGFPGLVLHVLVRGIERARNGAGVLRAGAGEPWDAVVARSVDEGWAGLECLSGIPGLVGATPIQNVGAYGQEVAETISEVEVLDLESGAVSTLSNAECRFAYRDSRFKREDRGRFAVLAVRFALRPGGEPAVRYPELARALAGAGPVTPGLRQVRETVLAVRRRKSMVIDADDPNCRSVGSFFVNPVMAEDVAEEVRQALRGEGRAEEADAMPAYPAGPGRVKLSAAWLIERAGLERGFRQGNAGISTNHTLALVNCGGATAREVVGLAREVRRRVRERFGVELVPEPVLVGLQL